MSLSALLLAALISVESGGNSLAVGDGGKAVGALQIWPGVVEDVNRFAGTHYTLSDRLSKEKSVAMCEAYLGHYATAKRLGRAVTDEDRARIWNGGPSGWKKPATEIYWRRVKLAMWNQQQQRRR